MRVFFGHLITILVLTVSNPLEADEPLPGSLQPLFDEAQDLALNPATQDDAIMKLDALVASHRSNSKLYDQALAKLFRLYIQNNRGEQAARLAADTMELESARIEQLIKGPLQHLLEEARRTFPAEFAKVAAARKQKSRVQFVLNPKTVEADLAQDILQRGDKELREKSLAALRDQLAPGSQTAGLGSSDPQPGDVREIRPRTVPETRAAAPKVRRRPGPIHGGIVSAGREHKPRRSSRPTAAS